MKARQYRMRPEVFQAASSGNLSFFNELKDPNDTTFLEVTPQKKTVLHVALQFKKFEAAEEIVKSSPSLVFVADSKGNTPLHVAARVGSSSMVKVLIQQWDVEGGGQWLVGKLNQEWDTALHEAVRYNHEDVVKELIKVNPELANCLNRANESALFLAVDRQHYKIASHILKTVPNCSYSGRDGMNVWHALVIHTSSFVELELLPWWYPCWGCFLSKPWTSDIDFVDELKKTWPSAIKQGDESGSTPLHVAAQVGNEKCVKLLLESDKSSAYVKDKSGVSALHVAAKEGNVNVIKELITNCPDLYELLDKRGRNALHVAAERGKYATVKFFLRRPEFEVLINEQDLDGNTPMHLAAIKEHHGIVYLLGHGRRVHLNDTNEEGFTVMDNVLSRMKLGSWLMRALWTKGARPSLRGALLRIGVKKLTDPRRKLEKADHRMSDSESDFMKQMTQTDLLVATLIATVTFTAGFTVPGGYKNEGVDEGLAVLSKSTAFRTFLIANNLAFGLSIASVLIHFTASAMIKEIPLRKKVIGLTPLFTGYSTLALLVAFISGTYTVVPQSMGITTAIIIGGCLLSNRIFSFLYHVACYFVPLQLVFHLPFLEE